MDGTLDFDPDNLNNLGSKYVLKYVISQKMTMFEQFNEQLPVHYIYLNVHDPKKGPPGLLRCHFKNVFRPFLKRSLTYITFNSVYNI